MELTKSILTGRVVLPTDAAPINAELVFTLSGLDSGVAYNAIDEWRKAIGGGDIERAFLASSEGLTKNADGTEWRIG